jgi:hypothetical protein
MTDQEIRKEISEVRERQEVLSDDPEVLWGQINKMLADYARMGELSAQAEANLTLASHQARIETPSSWRVADRQSSIDQKTVQEQMTLRLVNELHSTLSKRLDAARSKFSFKKVELQHQGFQ